VLWDGNKHDVSALSKSQLKKLEAAFEEYQSTRKRDAVYGYLTAVYRFARRFEKASHRRMVGQHMLALKDRGSRKTDNAFSAILRATSTVNEQTRWKWVQCLAFARREKIASDALQSFIKKHDGINECADEWVRRR
jgi:hypothetical protein